MGYVSGLHSLYGLEVEMRRISVPEFWVVIYRVALDHDSH